MEATWYGQANDTPAAFAHDAGLLWGDTKMLQYGLGGFRGRNDGDNFHVSAALVALEDVDDEDTAEALPTVAVVCELGAPPPPLQGGAWPEGRPETLGTDWSPPITSGNHSMGKSWAPMSLARSR